jgi:hypothetical protein
MCRALADPAEDFPTSSGYHFQLTTNPITTYPTIIVNHRSRLSILPKRDIFGETSLNHVALGTSFRRPGFTVAADMLIFYLFHQFSSIIKFYSFLLLS